MIEYRDIYKAFDHPVLSGVSLTVESGERLAIVGPSGTGKSVLLKTTIGLVVPDRGDVLVEGESVYFGTRGALDRVRRKVGYVFQNSALFDSMTVYDNMTQGIREDELKSMRAPQVLARVSRALEDVNLDPGRVLTKRPAELSGGMRKRVGLARALVGHPAILLYDEPVTGLDPVNSAAVSLLIRQIAERSGVTSVLVTHDIEGALELSDRIALLDDGRLAFIGTPLEFKSSPEPLVRAFADRRVASEAAAERMEVTT
ncbi:MAG: ATP-binding cassette domain-containing protein [Deltaproteobacteria bacterium]|nr:ATP-binding cassette domain-containing protein [Deltaproteobacteria bacterium]